MSKAGPYSMADQVARFANAKKEENKRFLDIASVYDGSKLKGLRVLVTGAEQGLGLELMKELVAQGAAKAICACRASSAELDAEKAKSPDVIQVITGVDVTKDDTMQKMCDETGEPVDIVINNAGYFYGPAESVGIGREGHLNFPQELLQIDVCAVGPLRISSALYKAGKLLGGKSKIIIITSQAGSCEWRLTQNPTPAVGAEFHGNYGHHMSRAACNIMGVILAQEMRADNIPVQLMHPGFNRTAMTKKYEHIWDIEGAVPADQGAKRVLYESLKADMSTTGTFVNTEDGLLIPW
jgi:NAD(P)-dependent dehydrogenase (short-subunit alcohol dehydrogenase family)